MYTAALSAGVSGGIIISGLITTNLSWRYIYFIAAAIVGAVLILVFFTFPETAYNRTPVDIPDEIYTKSAGLEDDENLEKGSPTSLHVEAADNGIAQPMDTVMSHSATTIPKKKSFVQNIALFDGVFIHESYWRMFYRPIILLAFPPVLWATLVMSVTIGFLVAISSNFASAFATTYGFSSTQSGLCFISGFVGTMMGILFGGKLSDQVADYFTRRNNGIREPEMRLPAMTIGLICSPLGLILYGVGIEKNLHWIVPTLGLGFCE